MRKGLLLILILLLVCTGALAAEPDGPYTYDTSWVYVTGYTGKDTALTMPASYILPDTGKEWTVDTVAKHAFENRTELVSVTFPDGYAAVLENAFAGCTGLQTIVLPDSMSCIDAEAFSGCTSLTSVIFGAGQSLIRARAFQGDSALHDVTFTGALCRIERGAFDGIAEDAVFHVPSDLLDEYTAELRWALNGQEPNVVATGNPSVPYDFTTDESLFEFDAATGMITGYSGYLYRVDIPATIGGVPVKSVGRYAFNMRHRDGYLHYLTLPEGLEALDPCAFDGAELLAWINFPSTLREIGSEAFDFDGERLLFNDGLETIGDKAFYHCGLQFTTIRLPDSVKSIGAGAFQGASLTSLTLPASLETIGERAFYLASLEDCTIVVPEGVVSIGPEAFAGCRIEALELPLSLTEIGSQAFATCIRLQRITFAGDTLPELPGDVLKGAWKFEGKGNGEIYIAYSDEAHLAAAAEKLAALEIAGTVRMAPKPGVVLAPIDDFEIIVDGSNHFLGSYHGDDDMLIAPAKIDGRYITRMNEGALRGNQTIRYFELPDNGKYSYVGDEAFANSAVETVILPEGIRYLGERAFLNCKNLTSIVLPSTLTGIGEGAFEGCANLREVVILSELSILRKDTFRGCTALTELSIPDSVTVIGDGAFAECTGMETLTLPVSLSSLAGDALEGSGIQQLIVKTENAETVASRLLSKFRPMVRVADDASDELLISLGAILERAADDPVMRVDGSFVIVEEPPVELTPDSQYAGLWALTLMRIGDLEADPANLGFIMTFDLNADGTALLHVAEEGRDETSELRWGVVEGDLVLTADGDTLTVHPDGDQFVMNDDGIEMVFTLGGAKEPTAQPVAPSRVPVTEADVIGAWKLDQIQMEGLVFDVEALGGFEMRINLNADGTADVSDEESTESTTWSIVDGDVMLMLEDKNERFCCDGTALYYDDEDLLMFFIRDDAAPAAATPVTTAVPAAAGNDTMGLRSGLSIVRDELAGKWFCIHLASGGATGNPMTMWGLVITLELNDDGTGVMNYGSPDAGQGWYYDSANDMWYYGSGGGDRVDAPLRFTSEGYLVHGTVSGGYMLFSRNPSDVPTVYPEVPAYVPEATATPTPAPTAAPAANTGADYIGVKYVCTSATASGVTLSPEMLGGEYAVTLHADGTATFILVGQSVPSLSWSREGDDIVINYFGTPIRLTPSGNALLMDYFGAMTLTMEAQK